MAKKKMRQLTGDLSDEFSDVFGFSSVEDDSVVEPKTKTASPDSRSESTQSNTNQPDLKEWLVQDAELSSLRKQIDELNGRYANEKELWENDREALDLQLQNTHKQTLALRSTISILESQNQKHIQQQKDDREIIDAHAEQNQSLVEQVQEQISSTDLGLLAEMFKERGLSTHSDFVTFFKTISQTPHCWPLFKDCRVPQSLMEEFLKNEVHLVDESLLDVLGLTGISIPVINHRCEVSHGVDLLTEIRELQTEILLLGWNRVLILGVSKTYVTLIRNQMGTGTIELQVDNRESKWLYSEEMKSFSVIFVIGQGRDQIPSDCPAQVFDSVEPRIGPAFQSFRQALQQYEAV